MKEEIVLEKEGFTLYGLRLPAFIIITILVLLGTYLEILPKGMIGALPFMIVVGAILNEIGPL